MAKSAIRMKLREIELLDRLQTRESLDSHTLEEYTRFYAEGVELPPLAVYAVDDGRIVLIDGFHRLAALRAQQNEPENAIVRFVGKGDLEGAHVLALKANVLHGLARRAGDKRRSIWGALDFDLKGARSMGEDKLAELCSVSSTYARKIKAKWSEQNAEDDDSADESDYTEDATEHEPPLGGGDPSDGEPDGPRDPYEVWNQLYTSRKKVWSSVRRALQAANDLLGEGDEITVEIKSAFRIADTATHEAYTKRQQARRNRKGA